MKSSNEYTNWGNQYSQKLSTFSYSVVHYYSFPFMYVNADTAVIIDNGSSLVEAGIAGDDDPCVVFPCIVGHPHQCGMGLLHHNQPHQYDIKQSDYLEMRVQPWHISSLWNTLLNVVLLYTGMIWRGDLNGYLCFCHAIFIATQCKPGRGKIL